jgi:hypothetical protein
MRSFAKVVVALALVACGGDDGGNPDVGKDTLPKAGTEPGDPTIVSAVGTCELENNVPFIVVNAEALDPMGEMNLGDCSATIDSMTQQAPYSSGCALSFVDLGCSVGQSVIVDLTVWNKTAGHAMASLTLMLLR